MNSKEIFTIALNLIAPWYIEDIKMSKPESGKPGQIDIYLNFRRGAKFTDTSGQECSVHDTVARTWQHLSFFEHTCLIHARVPRIVSSDDKVRTIPVPWARKNSGFTLLYEAYSMLLIESEMPVKRAANILNIKDMRLWRIFKYWIGRAFSEERIEDVTQIGIDETSIKKGHNYVTLTVDMQKRRVIYASPGKDAETIEKLQSHLSDKGCAKENIEHVSIDMSPAFIFGVTKYFPNAKITFDKFHVTKMINEAMDEVRKAERKQITELKGYKYIFLKNNNKLKAIEQEQKVHFLYAYPKLGESYRLKELFNDFWDLQE